METDGSGAVTRLDTAPVIDAARCSGCGRCVAACPEKLISLEVCGFRKHAVVQPSEQCVACGRCIVDCPLKAIQG